VYDRGAFGVVEIKLGLNPVDGSCIEHLYIVPDADPQQRGFSTGDIKGVSVKGEIIPCLLSRIDRSTAHELICISFNLLLCITSKAFWCVGVREPTIFVATFVRLGI